MIKLNYSKNNFTKLKKYFANIIYYDIMCLMLSEKEGDDEKNTWVLDIYQTLVKGWSDRWLLKVMYKLLLICINYY